MPNRSNRMEEHFEAETPLLEQCSTVCQQTFEEYPLGVTLGVFAAGLGVGVMVGAALAKPLGFQHEITAETLGRRVLHSISDLLPESVQRQIGV